MTTTLVYPKIVLVGRANVGKSTLFNRLTSSTKSIVFDYEGVTRDYVHELVNWDDKTFDLIDSGGFVAGAEKDPIASQVQEGVKRLMQDAALIVFVCDVKNGIAPDDTKLAKLIHKTKRPAVVVLNKADNRGLLEQNKADFLRLGFKTMLPISATHGSGIADLLEAMSQHVGTPEEAQEEPSYQVAILGKPNVGKSSLMNLLLDCQRTIVSDVAGTTREAITEKTFCCSDVITLTDTPGVRRSRSVTEPLENLMVKSALAAVRNADLVMLVIDASAGTISDQELKLLFYAYEQRKMILLVCNKVDLVTPELRESLEDVLSQYDFIIRKVPVVWISCATRKNVKRIFDEVNAIWQRCHQEMDSLEVNELVREKLEGRPLVHTKIPLVVKKVKRMPAPIPTFVLFVNHPQWFGDAELACIENIIRKEYDLRGCPLHLIPRKG